MKYHLFRGIKQFQNALNEGTGSSKLETFYCRDGVYRGRDKGP